jgi:hypothetical protein
MLSLKVPPALRRKLRWLAYCKDSSVLRVAVDILEQATATVEVPPEEAVTAAVDAVREVTP